MRANLVRTEKPFGRTRYVYACIDCGNEFFRMQANDRINPYCCKCSKKYQKIRDDENRARRQAEHDRKIIDECIDIVKFHSNEYDGIHWAIRELEHLKDSK